MWTYTHPLGPWSTTIAAITALLCGGCASMLPSSHTDSSSFQSFEEARSVIEGLVPVATTAEMVEKSGMGMDAQPNSKLLTHSDVVRLLVPASVLRAEDLDPGVLACAGVNGALGIVNRSGALPGGHIPPHRAVSLSRRQSNCYRIHSCLRRLYEDYRPIWHSFLGYGCGKRPYVL